MSSKSVVVLGESGMLGGYLAAYLTETGFKVICPERFDAASISEDEIARIITPTDAAVVINSIGVIRQRDVGEEEMMAVNAEFSQRLASVCEQLKVPFIHISTDCVFSGARGDYSESDVPDATDAYGRSKAVGEPASASVVRTSLIGSERRNKRSLLEWVKSNVGSEVDGYANQKWNGVTCLQLAKFLETVIAQDEYWKGVHHYYSPRAVSKYELVSLIADAYGLDIRVKKTDAKEARDMTLTSEYPFVSPPDIREQLAELYTFDKTHSFA